MAIIKSGNSVFQLIIDAIGALRSTLYHTDGTILSNSDGVKINQTDSTKLKADVNIVNIPTVSVNNFPQNSQDVNAILKESGGKDITASRTLKLFYAENFLGSQTEQLITLIPVTDNIAGQSTQSYIIPNGKRFVILGISAWTKNNSWSNQWMRCVLRCNPLGVVTTSSTIASPAIGVSTNSSSSGVADFQSMLLSQGYPNHFEIQGNGTLQIGVSAICQGSTSGFYFYMWGYEY